MEIILMRHGRTAGNIAKRFNGRTDDPLCPEGIEHAHLTGIDETVGRVYVSPLKRAMETAAIKFPKAAYIITEDLREMDFGDFEGRNAEDLKDNAEYIKWLQNGGALPCPGGEAIGDFTDRVCRAFDAIVREGLDNGEERLVIVAHGGSLMSILSRYGRPERTYYEWSVDNCNGFRGSIDPVTWGANPILEACERFESIGIE